MKYNIKFSIIFLIIFLIFFSSCQTNKQTSEFNENEASFREEEDVASAIGEDSSDSEDDLESEFVDSEDFEKDILEDASLEEDFEQTESAQNSAEQEIMDEEVSVEESAPDRETTDIVDEDDLPENREDGEADEKTADSEEIKDQKKELAAIERDMPDSPDSVKPSDSEPDEEENPASSPSSEDEAFRTTNQAPDSVLSEEEPNELPNEQPVASPNSVITNIRYVADENTIYIDSPGELSYQSRENTNSNQYIVEIENAVLSENLKWPFIMKDFDTQMMFLKADQKDKGTVRVVIQMQESSNVTPSISISESGSLAISSPVLSSPENTTAVSNNVSDSAGPVFDSNNNSTQSDTNEGGTFLNSTTTIEDLILSNPRFTGAPISIHLQDVDVRDVLYFISEGTGLNMVVNDDVRGKISIKLRNVPWDQALMTIMKTKQLGYIREGNVLRIMTFAALKRTQADIQTLLTSQKVLEPLKVKVIPVVYTRAQNLITQLNPFLTRDRGQVIADEKTNSLIITDISSVIKRLETLISKLDKTPQQVMIEAKIVEARESFVRNFGLGWGYASSGSTNLFGNPQLNLDIGGGIDAFPTVRSSAGNVGGRTLGSDLRLYLGSIAQLDAFLGISEADGLARVISSPRVMVLNGEKAKISQSTETISVSTQQSRLGETLGTSAQRTPIVLNFEVEPQITVVGSVFMSIKMRREFPGPIEDESTQARAVNSREAETRVLVKNGQTIVIGGIYQEDKTGSDEGIPILKHIPILKWLFTRTTSDNQRNELLLFLTPRVIDFPEDAQKLPHG